MRPLRSVVATVVFIVAAMGGCSSQSESSKPFKVDPYSVQRMEILYLPERIETRAALTPEMLEKAYYYKLEIRDLAATPEREQLVGLVRNTSISPTRETYDLRTAVLLYDKDGKRLAALYFDKWGKHGVINSDSGVISSGFYKWAKALMRGVAE